MSRTKRAALNPKPGSIFAFGKLKQKRRSTIWGEKPCEKTKFEISKIEAGFPSPHTENRSNPFVNRTRSNVRARWPQLAILLLFRLLLVGISMRHFCANLFKMPTLACRRLDSCQYGTCVSGFRSTPPLVTLFGKSRGLQGVFFFVMRIWIFQLDKESGHCTRIFVSFLFGQVAVTQKTNT